MTQLTIGLVIPTLAPTIQRIHDVRSPASRAGMQAALHHQPPSTNPYRWDSSQWFHWRLAYFTQHLAYSAPLLSNTVPAYYDHPAGTHQTSWT